MEKSIKAFELFWEIYNKDLNFKDIVEKNLANGKIRFFNDEEWNKIKSQNFISQVSDVTEFMDMFLKGYNIGNCVGMTRQLSYSYDDVAIVSGRLPILKGTLNAEQEGGHCWLETPQTIIDSSLMLVIDKSLKDSLGYIEEERITAFQLNRSPLYQARKEYVNDENISKENSKKK